MGFQYVITFLLAILAVYLAYRLSGLDTFVKFETNHEKEKSELEFNIHELKNKKRDLSELEQNIIIVGNIEEIDKQIKDLTKKLNLLNQRRK